MLAIQRHPAPPALFSANINSYVFVFWLPTVIENASGLSATWSTLLSGLPYAAGFFATLLFGYLSDRSGRRKMFTIIPMLATAALLTLSSVPGQPFWLVMVWLTLTGAAFDAYPPSFWVLPTMTLRSSAAAASIGVINSIGNLSGSIAPSIVGILLHRGFSECADRPVSVAGTRRLRDLCRCSPRVGEIAFIPRTSRGATQCSARVVRRRSR